MVAVFRRERRCGAADSGSHLRDGARSGIWLAGPSADALSYDEIKSLLGNPLVKIVMFVGISPVLFFAVHRIRHLIIDLHAPVPGLALVAVSYLSAAAGAVLTAIFLWRI